MDQMSKEVRVLYYLNLESRRMSPLEYIVQDHEAWDYYFKLCSQDFGTASAKQIAKKIMKSLKKAAA